MIMKYKAGDKVRCIKSTSAVGVEVGNVYTVIGFSHVSDFGVHIALKGVKSTPTQDVFELVQEDAVLTPEEVFKHLRVGTELEIFGRFNTRTDSIEKWLAAPPTHRITYNTIVSQIWRIKPEPEVIELNGKKYREIID